MEVEHRIAGTDIGIPAWVSTNGVVAPTMQSQRSLKKVREGLEIIIAGDKSDHIGRLGRVGEEERDVALQAARVIVQSTSVADFGSVRGRTEIDDVVGEGTGVNATAAGPGRDGEVDAEGANVEHAMRDG